jgi:outer membrane lipoprotein SlyB
MKGTVISLRPVQISGTESGLGAGAGAVAGGAAGSYAGGNDVRTNIIGAVGGAIVGGAIGAATEKALTEAGAVEFIIQQDNGQTIALVQVNDQNLQAEDRVLILRSDTVRIIRDETGTVKKQ